MEMIVRPREDDITHVVLSGRFDSIGAEEIRESLSAATAGMNRSAVVDMSGVDFLSSRGIGLLFLNGKKLKKTGHQLIIVNPQEVVRAVLRIVQFEEALPVVGDLDEAVRLLQSDAGPRTR